MIEIAWSAPMTAVSGAQYTAAQYNTYTRDNFLETVPAKATTATAHFVATGANQIAERVPSNSYVTNSQTTTSTSFTNLASVGPSNAVTSGTIVLIGLYCVQSNSSAGADVFMGYDVSGATTLAASTDRAIKYDSPVAASSCAHGAVFMQTSLTAGANTFTAKYRVSSGTGTYSERRQWVLPF